jgi:ferric-dicitrate binding protein FerR (iron transport regulator)
MRTTLLIPLFVLISCGSTEKTQPPSVTQSIQLKATTSADGRAALSFKKNNNFQEAKPGESFTDGTTLKTSAAGQAALSTPWSKRFELNNNTELSFASNVLRLTQGEIFVDAPPGKPLLVKLPQGDVTIEGAALNIKQQDKGAEINVLKGNVNVAGAKGSVSLNAAEGAKLSPDGTPQKGPSADFTALTE